jgi:hypothetical protein
MPNSRSFCRTAPRLSSKRDWPTWDPWLRPKIVHWVSRPFGNCASTGTKTDFKVQGHDPTFSPSDIRFQTYPWKKPGVSNYDPVAGLDGESRLNYLCYLEMTDGDKPPSTTDPKAFLNPAQGAWTDGVDPSTEVASKFGAYKLTGRKFLEGYLIPKLTPLNNLMTTDVATPNIGIQAWFDHVNWNFSLDLHIGKDWEKAGDSGKFKRNTTNFNANDASGIGAMFKDKTWDGLITAAGVTTMATLPTDALVWTYAHYVIPSEAYHEDKSQALYNAYHWGNASSKSHNPFFG